VCRRAGAAHRQAQSLVPGGGGVGTAYVSSSQTKLTRGAPGGTRGGTSSAAEVGGRDSRLPPRRVSSKAAPLRNPFRREHVLEAGGALNSRPSGAPAVHISPPAKVPRKKKSRPKRSAPLLGRRPGPSPEQLPRKGPTLHSFAFKRTSWLRDRLRKVAGRLAGR